MDEFKGAKEQIKREIIEAYLFLRENNHTIPSETLEFIKVAAINAVEGLPKLGKCHFCKHMFSTEGVCMECSNWNKYE